MPKIDGFVVLIISLYVDDLLVTGNNSSLVEKFKKKTILVFKMEILV